ncbi:MAG: DUF3445 domain-containing protein [Synechococcaceae cyanobacterium SM2_3_2]|nr:DUF3445 domain-containing protein [Synechococcaceae cyanobacterium SM2_3_2]
MATKNYLSDPVVLMQIYLPFEKTNLKLGLQPLDLTTWLQVDEQLLGYGQTKAHLLNHRREDVWASSPGSEGAQQEVLDLVIEFLCQQHPNLYHLRDGKITVVPLQQTWDPQDFAACPLDLAARLIQEDLCVMQPGSQGYLLTAGCVCFPSHWQLRSKWGQPVATIHDPVPDYEAKLHSPVDNFLTKLTVDRPGYRFNWSLVDTPELFLGDVDSPAPSSKSISPDLEGSHWIRVERQTLRRLPQTQAVLFTIRIYVYPLSILRDHPDAAQRLATTIEVMPEAMQQYKRIDSIRADLLAYLGSLA